MPMYVCSAECNRTLTHSRKWSQVLICDQRLEHQSVARAAAPAYILFRIQRGADALANLPPRARWFPQGDAASRQRNGSRDRQPSSDQSDEGFFLAQ